MEIFRLELKRAIFNKWTLFSALVALIICLIPIPEKIEMMEKAYSKDILDNGYAITNMNIYTQWILYDRFSNYLYIFLFTMPLLCAFPYGASYYSDVRSGYINQLLTRCDMKTYTISKYFATFISGGAVITIPLILQFLILMLIFPLQSPSRFSTPISGEPTFCIDLFFDYPILHTLLWCLIVFVVAGLLATLALVVSRGVYNYFGIILTPFLISFILIFVSNICGENEIAFLSSISSWVNVETNYWILFTEIAVMFILSFVSFVFQKREVL